jgi:group I intron endonuclease
MNNSQLDEKDNLGIITETTNLTRKNAWSVIGKIIGIYKIINKVNGKYYIGSSNDIHKRWKQHINFLNKGNHQNDYLQRSWNKYGKDQFEFLIVKEIPSGQLVETEQKYLDNIEKEKCYNLSLIAGKVEMTEETRNKIRQKAFGHKRNLGRKYDLITFIRRANSRRNNGKPWCSEETKKKISVSHTGKSLSKEHKRKVGQSCKGKIPHNKDYTTRTFFNKITNETFTGTKSDFIKKYNLLRSAVYDVINGKRQSHKGWIVQ